MHWTLCVWLSFQSHAFINLSYIETGTCKIKMLFNFDGICSNDRAKKNRLVVVNNFNFIYRFSYWLCLWWFWNRFFRFFDWMLKNVDYNIVGPLRSGHSIEDKCNQRNLKLQKYTSIKGIPINWQWLMFNKQLIERVKRSELENCVLDSNLKYANYSTCHLFDSTTFGAEKKINPNSGHRNVLRPQNLFDF